MPSILSEGSAVLEVLIFSASLKAFDFAVGAGSELDFAFRRMTQIPVEIKRIPKNPPIAAKTII